MTDREFWLRYRSDVMFHVKVDAASVAAANSPDACRANDSCYHQKLIAAREAIRLWSVTEKIDHA